MRPGQSRRVDLAYARTDMRSQGRTERRALLALDGAEDMQGGYVQLTRSTQRTDLYLTVGPEPLGPDEEQPHPSREARAPEELLARVLSRDRGKTLATDTPDVVDVRRLSTRALRAERDRLAQLRADCPPDRSRELRLAAQRAGEAEQARQQARQDRQAAAEQLATLRVGCCAADPGRQGAAGAGRARAQDDDRAGGPGTPSGGGQRRAHLGWMEAHDVDLRVRERAVTREDAWRRRVDQHALALDPPGWLLAELGPVPSDSRERAVWRVAAAELDGYRRAYGLEDPGPAKHGGGKVTRQSGRRSRPQPPPRRGMAGCAGRRSAIAAAILPPATRSTGDPVAAGDATGWMRAGCWAPNHAGRPPAAGATGRASGRRWSAWPTTTTATATTVTAPRSAPAAYGPATWAARNATAARSLAEGAAMGQHPHPDDFPDQDLDEELGRPLYQGDGHDGGH